MVIWYDGPNLDTSMPWIGGGNPWEVCLKPQVLDRFKQSEHVLIMIFLLSFLASSQQI